MHHCRLFLVRNFSIATFSHDSPGLAPVGDWRYIATITRYFLNAIVKRCSLASLNVSTNSPLCFAQVFSVFQT